MTASCSTPLMIGSLSFCASSQDLWVRLRLGFRFVSQPTIVQHGFGITAGLSGAGKDQLARRLKGMAGFLIGRHGPVIWIRLVLLIHHGGHAGEGFSNLLF